MTNWWRPGATWPTVCSPLLTSIGEGIVPDPGELQKDDLALLAEIEKGFDTVGTELDAVKLRAALNEAMRLASEVNKYLDTTAPLAHDQDRQTGGRPLHLCGHESHRFAQDIVLSLPAFQLGSAQQVPGLRQSVVR